MHLFRILQCHITSINRTIRQIMDMKTPNTLSENRKRDNDMKWNGWGFRDSYFFVNNKGTMQFNGKRYDMGGKTFLGLIKWMQSTLNMDVQHSNFGKEKIDETEIPPPILNPKFIEFLKSENIAHSTDGLKRVHRSHGHTIRDMVKVRLGTCEKRIPDLIVWPTCHEDVVKIVNAANDFNVVIIPIGGGTSVSEALKCPENETRCIVSLDTNDMNKILWLDGKNLVAKAQCGILGIDLEKQLNDKLFTLGHEPDSIEFSSLGGWVATRASGIKKNKYGNIEDILVHITFVTSKGVIQKSCMAPRISSGPDIHHMIIGSEGILGVVTEVTFKICPLPQCKKFGSVLFPTFENGVEALRHIAKEKIAPASIRLMDNEQLKFGRASNPSASFFTTINDFLKRLYVTQWRRFDLNRMAPATIIFEGNKDEVEMQQKLVYAICKKYGGIPAGGENGRCGYQLTFLVAYLRDMGMDYMAIGESFETSAPWDCVLRLCNNVKELSRCECLRLGVRHPPLISYRVTQLYDAGACIYFYFGFNYRDLEHNEQDDKANLLKKALHVYEQIEIAAREEILACGGSISHHHGVGKLRKRWLPRTVGDVGLGVLQAVKNHLDPNNVFANGNLFNIAKL